MNKLQIYTLNILALGPMFAFVATSIYLAQVSGVWLDNIHWLIIGILALQCDAARVINMHRGIAQFYVIGVVLNLLLLLALAVEIEVSNWITQLFVIDLAVGFILAMVNHYNNKKLNKQPLKFG